MACRLQAPGPGTGARAEDYQLPLISLKFIEAAEARNEVPIVLRAYVHWFVGKSTETRVSDDQYFTRTYINYVRSFSFFFFYFLKKVSSVRVRM